MNNAPTLKMKTFRITIEWSHPYPKSLAIQQTASGLGAAVGRAIRQWRKENKGRRIKNIVIKCIQL